MGVACPICCGGGGGCQCGAFGCNRLAKYGPASCPCGLHLTFSGFLDGACSCSKLNGTSVDLFLAGECFWQSADGLTTATLGNFDPLNRVGCDLLLTTQTPGPNACALSFIVGNWAAAIGASGPITRITGCGNNNGHPAAVNIQALAPNCRSACPCAVAAPAKWAVTIANMRNGGGFACQNCRFANGTWVLTAGAQACSWTGPLGNPCGLTGNAALGFNYDSCNDRFALACVLTAGQFTTTDAVYAVSSAQFDCMNGGALPLVSGGQGLCTWPASVLIAPAP